MDHGEAIGMMAGAYFVGRAELLRWINELTSLNYTKIEQTANGVFACHVFDALFPGEVRLEKVNFNARYQYEFVHNYKVLQAAFNRLTLKKQIDVEKLIKGKYQDNLEFIQWVKAFYDSHASENALQYDGRARRDAILAKGRGGARPALNGNRPRAADPGARPGVYGTAPRPAKTRSAGAERMQPPTEPMVKKVDFDLLKEENARLQQAVQDGETEREFYFNKLRNVELIIQDLEDDVQNQDDPVDPYLRKAVDQIKQILYAEDDVDPQGHADPATPAGSEEQPYADQDVLPEEAAHQEIQAGGEY